MPERAHVGSVEAVEAFRARLIGYLDKARPVLEEVSADLRKVQYWLETEQRVHWERELRRRERALDEAKQSLFSAQLSDFREAGAFEQSAVHRARRALEECRESLDRVRRWSRDLGPRTEPLTRRVQALDTVFSHEMAMAVAFLTEVVRHLAAYAGLRPSTGPGEPHLPSTAMPPAPAPANPSEPPPNDGRPP
ncbi:MAG: hypothetical protein KF833_23605 [Verrucomicrobiae bacterium]|nr:hypothetical protein [Verrucomicrobiae bacterium]